MLQTFAPAAALLRRSVHLQIVGQPFVILNECFEGNQEIAHAKGWKKGGKRRNRTPVLAYMKNYYSWHRSIAAPVIWMGFPHTFTGLPGPSQSRLIWKSAYTVLAVVGDSWIAPELATGKKGEESIGKCLSFSNNRM